MREPYKIESGHAPGVDRRPLAGGTWSVLLNGFTEVGQSFFVPESTKHDLGYLYRLARRMKIKVSMTYVTGKNERGAVVDGVQVQYDGVVSKRGNSL